MKKRILWLSLAFAFLCLPWSAPCKTNEELARENEDLRRRVEQLEQQLEVVLQALDVKSDADASAPKSAETSKPGKPSFPITGQFPLEVYGHFRLDTAYDDSRTNSGNTAKYALSGSDEDDDEFNMTARHTRLGLRLNVPETNRIKIDGRAEVDFYGKGDELQNNLRLRHAYFTLQFPDDWTLLAGQTWDVHAPVNAKTLNTAIGWSAGNLGYRRPQLRLEKGFGDGDRRLLLQMAAARPYASDHDADTHDDAEDAGIPDLQARVSYRFPGPAGKPITLGLGGHWGQREMDLGGLGDENFDSWSLVLDAHIPLHEMLALEGELWTGQFLEAYQGGILQGFNASDSEEVESRGGFAQLLFTPSKDWKAFAGFGIDDPVDSTVSKRKQNAMYFVNVRRSLTRNAWIGLEYMRLVTDYKGGESAEDNRFQTTFYLWY